MKQIGEPKQITETVGRETIPLTATTFEVEPSDVGARKEKYLLDTYGNVYVFVPSDVGRTFTEYKDKYGWEGWYWRYDASA